MYKYQLLFVVVHRYHHKYQYVIILIHLNHLKYNNNNGDDGDEQTMKKYSTFITQKHKENSTNIKNARGHPHKGFITLTIGVLRG